MPPYPLSTRLITSIKYADFSSIEPLLELPSAREILRGLDASLSGNNSIGSFENLHHAVGLVKRAYTGSEQPPSIPAPPLHFGPRCLALSYDSHVACLDFVDVCFSAMRTHKSTLEMMRLGRPEDIPALLKETVDNANEIARCAGELEQRWTEDDDGVVSEAAEKELRIAMKTFWGAVKTRCLECGDGAISRLIQDLGTQSSHIEDQLVEAIAASWYTWLAVGHVHSEGARAVRTSISENYRVLPSSTVITVGRVSELAAIDDIPAFCVAAHKMLRTMQQRNEEKCTRLEGEQCALNETLRNVSESQVRACDKLKEKEQAKNNCEAELARQTSEMNGLRSQIHHENEEVARLRRKVEREQERQRDGLLSTIPIFGFVNAIVKKDARLAIPGYASIDGLISVIRGDLEGAEARLRRSNELVARLLEQANQTRRSVEETQAEVTQLAEKITRYQNEMDECERGIKLVGQSLCAVNGFRAQSLGLQTTYQFLRDDVDLVRELDDRSTQEECVEDLRRLALLST